MDDTFKQLGFTGPDGKPDEARMQEHTPLRVGPDQGQVIVHCAGCPSFELARRVFFGALRCLSIGGEEIGDLELLWTAGRCLLLQRIGRR
jgi:hypothetical protein